jgi:hypothetical protein
MLEREEYIEQAYFFRALRERSTMSLSTQELLEGLRDEVLSTTRLPLAIDFLAAELKLRGVLSPAMAKLGHYFAPFQTYVIQSAENDKLRFDFTLGLEILEREAAYRAESPTPQGVFLYQFESVCRNRLGYDRSLDAIAADPIFNADWREWIIFVRRQVGIVDFADLIFGRSEYRLELRRQQQLDEEGDEPERPVLFGVKEGKIALANRHKDPLFLFAALERQLKYPTVPRPRAIDKSRVDLGVLANRLERCEARLRLLEEEAKGGIDLSKYMPREGPG